MTLDDSLDGNKIKSRYAPVVFEVWEDPYFQVPRPRRYVYWPHDPEEAVPWAFQRWDGWHRRPACQEGGEGGGGGR